MRTAFVIALFVGACAAAQFIQGPKEYLREGHFIVSFKALEGLSEKEQNVIRQAITTIQNQYKGINLLQRSLMTPSSFGKLPNEMYLIRIPGNTQTIQAAINTLKANPSIMFIEQDSKVIVAQDPEQNVQTPNPISPKVQTFQDAARESWALDRLDQISQTLDKSFTYSEKAGQGVNVYLLDSGVLPSHKEFARGRVFPVEDFIADHQFARDNFGHGTIISSLIAGQHFGVAKNANIQGVRVINQQGFGWMSDVVSALAWVNKNGVNPGVIAMPFTARFQSPTMEIALRAVFANNFLPIVAAGNQRIDACSISPASSRFAFTVGATDQLDARAPWSNWGACLNCFAPGVKVPSALFVQKDSFSLQSQSRHLDAYATLSGTSQASAYAVGVAALFLAEHPLARAQQVMEFMQKSAISPLQIQNRGVVTGAGPGSPDLLLHFTNEKLALPLEPLQSRDLLLPEIQQAKQ